MQYRVDCRRKRTRVHPEISTNDVTKANLCHSAHRHELERQHRTDTRRLQSSERRGQAQHYARHSLNDATMLGCAPSSTLHRNNDRHDGRETCWRLEPISCACSTTTTRADE